MIGTAMPCAMCRNKRGDTSKELVVINLERLLSHTEPVKETYTPFNWSMDIHSRCRYGLSCNDLRVADSRLINRAKQLDKKLYAILSDDTKYHQALRLLSGNFSKVYHELESARNTLKRKIS